VHHPSHWRRRRAARPLLRVVLQPVPHRIRAQSVRPAHGIMYPSCGRVHWRLHCWPRGAGLSPGWVIRAPEPVAGHVVQTTHWWGRLLHAWRQGAKLLLLAVPVGRMACVCIGVIWVRPPGGITGLVHAIGVRRAPEGNEGAGQHVRQNQRCAVTNIGLVGGGGWQWVGKTHRRCSRDTNELQSSERGFCSVLTTARSHPCET
jgi:hypothetical protein